MYFILKWLKRYIELYIKFILFLGWEEWEIINEYFWLYICCIYNKIIEVIVVDGIDIKIMMKM